MVILLLYTQPTHLHSSKRVSPAGGSGTLPLRSGDLDGQMDVTSLQCAAVSSGRQMCTIHGCERRSVTSKCWHAASLSPSTDQHSPWNDRSILGETCPGFRATRQVSVRGCREAMTRMRCEEMAGTMQPVDAAITDSHQHSSCPGPGGGPILYTGGRSAGRHS